MQEEPEIPMFYSSTLGVWATFSEGKLIVKIKGTPEDFAQLSEIAAKGDGSVMVTVVDQVNWGLK